MISRQLPFQESIEHKIFRDQQKRNKTGYVNYDSFSRLYYEYQQIYYDYLLNLVINLIDYKNVPKTLPPQALEYMLRMYGYANLTVIDKDHIYVQGIGYDNVGVNIPLGSIIGGYGSNSNSDKIINDLLHGKEPVALTRINAETSEPPFYVTMSNNYSFYIGTNSSDELIIDRTAKTLAEIKAEELLNIRQQKTPFIGFTSDQNLTSKGVYEALEQGKPFINVDSSIGDDIRKVITTMPVQVPNLASTLKDSWNNAMSEFLTMIGLDNVAIDKKERLIAAEASSNDEQISKSMKIYLNARNAQLDLINEALGTTMKAVYNSEASINMINFARTGANFDSDSLSLQKRGEQNVNTDNK